MIDESQAWTPPPPPPLPENVVSYPDKPHWGPLAGIGAWLFSIAMVIIIPLAGMAVWFGIYVAKGNPIPATPEEINAWVTTEISGLIQVLGNIPAHLLTLALCWLIATRRGKVPFGVALGWKWEGYSLLAKIGYLCFVTAGVVAVLIILGRVMPPPEETAFDKLLKISASVRISVAIMAVLSAPIIEEVVYRGILFAGLVKKLGRVPTIIVVTMLFAAVHVPQYLESLQGIVGLTFLSLVITIVRAQTRSIFPCIIIHLINNIIGVIGIFSDKV